MADTRVAPTAAIMARPATADRVERLVTVPRADPRVMAARTVRLAPEAIRVRRAVDTPLAAVVDIPPAAVAAATPQAVADTPAAGIAKS